MIGLSDVGVLLIVLVVVNGVFVLIGEWVYVLLFVLMLVVVVVFVMLVVFVVVVDEDLYGDLLVGGCWLLYKVKLVVLKLRMD